ncbi:cysteine proteinase inhibitor B [Momordica charantia]|uniref:Cysteine proteinase inhibitor B n=1 Tax=Momordica charantia TaxID=3673 RepID=A0A6J1DAN3_MOMCH|nr:cysteine proteinase inhibitor B [Momordica charantia]
MARRRLIAAAIAIAAVTLAAAAEGYGGRLGGRTEIEDVRTNEEVQELGRFCVEEYNRRRNGGGEVRFRAVVAAEKQVVAGMKYYLKISGSVKGESEMLFDSIVIVKPWLRSKQLLHFSPSTILIANKF